MFSKNNSWTPKHFIDDNFHSLDMNKITSEITVSEISVQFVSIPLLQHD